MNNGINLVVKRVDPKQQKLQQQNRKIRLLGYGFLGLFTLSSVVLFLLLQFSPITKLRDQEQEISLKLDSQNEKIQNDIFITNQLGYINQVIDDRSDLPDVVASLLTVMPPSISIESYQVANGLIDLSVSSSSLPELETFFDQAVKLSEDKEIYPSITVSDISYNPSGSYTFSMVVQK